SDARFSLTPTRSALEAGRPRPDRPGRHDSAHAPRGARIVCRLAHPGCRRSPASAMVLDTDRCFDVFPDLLCRPSAVCCRRRRSFLAHWILAGISSWAAPGSADLSENIEPGELNPGPLDLGS